MCGHPNSHFFFGGSLILLSTLVAYWMEKLAFRHFISTTLFQLNTLYRVQYFCIKFSSCVSSSVHSYRVQYVHLYWVQYICIEFSTFVSSSIDLYQVQSICIKFNRFISSSIGTFVSSSIHLYRVQYICIVDRRPLPATAPSGFGMPGLPSLPPRSQPRERTSTFHGMYVNGHLFGV
jgi:hypothetical protein